MKNDHAKLLLHPLFLLQLSLLLLNDFTWKYEYHNWFTGKLSDFTGLFVFPVFFSAFFPGRKKLIFILTAALFVWWKSPYSNPLISFFNEHMGLPVYRVTDYTDCIALVVLPFAYSIREVNYSPSVMQNFAVCCVGVISVIAFSATSMPRYLTEKDETGIRVDKTIRTKKREYEIIKTLKTAGFSLTKDSVHYEPVWHYNYFLKVKDSSGEKMIPLDSFQSKLYRKTDYGSHYTIPQIEISGDTVKELRFVIYEYGFGKTDFDLHSFRHKTFSDSSSNELRRELQKKFARPLKKTFKKLLEE
jgi:hypothetical protein